MKKWLYASVVVLAVLVLALGGWTVKALEAVGRPLRTRVGSRKETS